jgi:MazG family protein
MSLTLAYIGAAAGGAPAVSLRALSGGGAVFVPEGLDAGLHALLLESVGNAHGLLEPFVAADTAQLQGIATEAAASDITVALAGPSAPQVARTLRDLVPPGVLTLVPEEPFFSDAVLGQELVSLKRIVDVLRLECPWDREQTPLDIIGYTVEEVYELADAIADGDLAAEHGELGDLLLQVVLLSLMLREQGAGDFGTVAHEIEVKLIRRHPHIFGDAVAMTAADVKGRWERIKVEQEGRRGIFHDVPRAAPALLYARKLQQRASAVGFDWGTAVEGFHKILEEHDELAELFAESSRPGFGPTDPDGRDPRVFHEIGDLLFATVNVARLLRVDPELALRETSRRFERRVDAAATLAAAEGDEWSELDLTKQEGYYQRAKAGEKAGADKDRSGGAA